MKTRDWIVATLMFALGVVGWVMIAKVSGRREAWDHWTYFALSYPLMMLAAGYAGFRVPARPWRWPLVLAAGQLVTLLVLSGAGSMLPLGVIVFLVLALPMLATSWAGARIARRRQAHA